MLVACDGDEVREIYLARLEVNVLLTLKLASTEVVPTPQVAVVHVGAVFHASPAIERVGLTVVPQHYEVAPLLAVDDTLWERS